MLIANRNMRMAVVGWLICVVAMLFYCYEYLLRIEPSVMMPDLMQNFQISATGLGYLSTAYLVGYAPLQLLVGPIVDRFGARLILIIALCFCVAGATLFGLTDAVWVAGVGRFIIGVGSAFVFVGVLRLAAMWLHPQYFAFFVGLTTALGMVGAMVGDIEMSHLVHNIGWRDTVYLSAFFGCLLIPIFLCFIYEPRPISNKTLRISNSLWHNTKKVLANKQVIIAGVIGGILYLSLSVFADIWGVGYIHVLLKDSKIQSSEVNAMVYFGWLVGAPLIGWLSEKVRSKKTLVMMGTLFSGVVFSIILFVPLHHVVELMALLFFFGFLSSVEVLCFAIGKESVPSSQVATALGVVNFFVMLGGMLILPLVGKFLDVFWSGVMQNDVRVYAASDYHCALIVVPLLFFVAFGLSFCLREERIIDEERDFA